MNEHLEYIRDHYRAARLSRDREIIDEVRLSLRLRMLEIMNSSLLNGYPDIHVSFSEGRYYNLSIIPWITFYDENITSTPKKGFYVVYLFSENLQRVYLSINQGWTFFDESSNFDNLEQKLDAAKSIAEKCRNLLGFDHSTTFLSHIDLDAPNNGLAQGYEACNIIALEYDLNNLPLNSDLESDFKFFMETYYSLIALIRRPGDDGLVNDLYGMLNVNVIPTEEQPRLMLTLVPNLTPYTPVNIAHFRAGKTDHEKVNRLKKIVGDRGELLVVNYERDRQLLLGRDPLCVVHKSLKDDRAGYDISSLNIDGEEIFIEVKSTVKSENEPFEISINEYAKFLELREKYFIYRVYNLHNNPRFFIIDYDYLQQLHKEATNYKIFINRD